MNEAYEFHDSTLSAINCDRGDCLIDLIPAYLHRSNGIPGVNAGQGFWQDVRIRIGGINEVPKLPLLPLSLHDGTVWFTGVSHQNVFPAGLSLRQKITVSLVPKIDGHALIFSGNSIVIELLGEAIFADDFPGTSQTA
jgi:hypothetical protein